MATYFLRQGGHGQQGPFEEARIAGWIADGRVRPGMHLSADGQSWMPVEEHRLFAAARAPAPARPVPSALPVRPVEGVEEVPEVEDRPRRPARRGPVRPTSSNSGALLAGGLVLVAIVVAVVMLGSTTGTQQPEQTAASGSRSQGTSSAAGVPVSTVAAPSRALETKAQFRDRWTAHQRTAGVGIWESDEEVAKKTIETVCGRRPDRTQQVAGSRYWYFDCSDGVIQFVWERWGVAWQYTINDY